jgi:hypothetical protein
LRKPAAGGIATIGDRRDDEHDAENDINRKKCAAPL